MNYFEFYEIPVKFNIDENALKVKFYSIAKENHPDFFINDQALYLQALSTSSTNNEAYKCLSNFYSRAAYILKLTETVFEEKLSPVFLMDMMEINEEVEDLRSENNSEKLKNLTAEIEKMSKSLNNVLRDLAELADKIEITTQKPLKQINENLQKHKYILRLKETLANIAAR